MRPTLHSALRPRLALGPGLAIAGVASFLLLRQGLLSDPPRDRSPRLSRTQVEIPAATGSAATASTAPDPAWLLAQRRALSLDSAQVKRLDRLRARWDRDTRPLQEALQRATARFQESLAAEGDPRQTPRQTPRQLQERAAPVSLLTGQLLAARRAWWDEAAGVLNISQRHEAERLWRIRFARVGAPAPVDRP